MMMVERRAVVVGSSYSVLEYELEIMKECGGDGVFLKRARNSYCTQCLRMFPTALAAEGG